MAFDRPQHLLEVFSDKQLPSVINLGLYVILDEEWVHCNDQSYSKLSAEQFEVLISKLRSQTHVKILNLGAACVGHIPGPVVCKQLAESLGRPTDLRLLQLGALPGNLIGNEGAALLAPIMEYLPELTALHLDWNEIGPSGIKALAPFLTRLTSLRILALGANRLGNEGGSCLPPSIAKMTLLQKLSLRGNDFNERTCCLFVPSLLNKRYLTEVELDKEPFQCIRSGAWKQSGIKDLPDEVVHLDWVEVIKHLSICNKGVVRQWSASDIDDSAFQNACADAVRKCSRPFPYTQICLVGEGRAGKTALASSMCGRAFKQTSSTIGVSVEHLQIAQSDCNSSSDWSTVHAPSSKVSLAEDQLAWAVVEQLDCNIGSASECVAGISPALAFDATSQHHNTFSLKCASKESAVLPAASQQLQATDAARPEEDAIPATMDSNSVSVPGVRLDKELVLKRSTESETFKIKLMDFGGQQAFYSLHHLYLTRHGVYLLVFNMEWLVGHRAFGNTTSSDGGSKRDSSLGYLSFWLNSIYLHAKSPDGSVAPVLLIGTHKDLISSPADHEAISACIYDKFKTSPAFGSVVPFKQGTAASGLGLLWFFPVDNTNVDADASIDFIKLTIHQKLLHEDYLKRPVPLPWLQLFDAVQSTKQLHMRISQVEAVAERFGFPLSQVSLEAEVASMLKFFTESGLLMHHDCPSLRDIVVLDVMQCLVAPASVVMCQHDIHMLQVHEKARSMHNDSYLLLTTEGVLSDTLLDVLWSSCLDIKREIIELMMFYGLMVPMLENDGAGHSSSQYLVPSLLPKIANSFSTLEVKAHCYFLLGMKTLTTKWEKVGNVSFATAATQGFSPAGLFARLTGKIISRCQSVYSFFGYMLGASEVHASFGSHVFVIRELPSANAFQLLVMVDNPRKLVNELSQLLECVVSEMMPSLGFCAAVLSDGSCSSNFLPSALSSVHFVALNHITHSISCNEIVHIDTSCRARMSAAEARKVFEKWVPPSTLRPRYDVFLSYRWTGSFDEDLTSSLFNNLSEDLVSSSGREIHVFLDKRRLQDGRNFQDDFADALFVTSLPVIILSTAALQRMMLLKADSPIDNLLLEWTLIVELLHTKSINFCLPIIIGSYSPSAKSCAGVFSNFFQDTVKAADGSKYSGIDSLPDVRIASIIDKARKLLQAHKIPESPFLSSHTVRSVVKHLSMHKAVFVSDIFQAPRFQAVPESHVKEETTRCVIEHCVGSIRSILDSMAVSSAIAVAPAAEKAAVAESVSSHVVSRRMQYFAAAIVGFAFATSLLLWRSRKK